ncbi:recombinase family protein [Paludisphaera rhizosphaerae]|uniref:recombinase family protein n=1 Tax=Paludisphaera rhizosphaerae TaxID=2711216 RepID=UPI0013E9B8A8|nr:recombinase family protein [Paludisphaera rhizosphaerae]
MSVLEGAVRVSALRSSKILDVHLDRLAVVYVRQSDPQQVLNHRESRERQYALADHAAALGWPRDRVLVIDDDQGMSGRSADRRGGFQRLLAEVTMEHVGLILGIEMSRIARNSRDWHNLLEMCAIFGTILADEDGVYDPRDTNDRLLLGLKGTISEFELVTMRNRLERGRLNKAQRGELFHRVPTGYVKLSTERVEFDPDEQVREVIRLIFDKYDEIGTAWGVFHYLIRNNIKIGFRPFHGPNRGNLEWRRPVLLTVFQILRHPIYAGAYAYGRRPHKHVRTADGERTGVGPWVPMEQWKVLKRDCLPAYITWERYLANQESLHQHRSGPGCKGSPRGGSALLAGLIVCGNCGRCLQPSYRTHARAYYSCVRHLHEGTEQTCFGLKAAVVDDLVVQQVLHALEPAALELSCRALEDVQQDRARLDKHWKQRLERARYEAVDAERRYRAVDPENRLVARSLEQRWEETLRAERQVGDDYDRFLREQPPQLSRDERALIAALSSDLPALWHAPDTTDQDRKEIVRHLVERVVVQVKNDSEYVDVAIHWQGGLVSRHEVVRPVRTYEQLRDLDKLMDRVVALRHEGRTAAEIAVCLNQEGFVPPKRCGEFYPELVHELLVRRGLSNEKKYADQLGSDEWWLPKLAEAVPVSAGKLADWARRGWLHSRRTPAQHLWILWADKQELKRLRKLAASSRRGMVEYPADLTTPKERHRGGHG